MALWEGLSQLQETAFLLVTPHICTLHLLKYFHIYYFIWVPWGWGDRAGWDTSSSHCVKREAWFTNSRLSSYLPSQVLPWPPYSQMKPLCLGGLHSKTHQVTMTAKLLEHSWTQTLTPKKSLPSGEGTRGKQSLLLGMREVSLWVSRHLSPKIMIFLQGKEGFSLSL